MAVCGPHCRESGESNLGIDFFGEFCLVWSEISDENCLLTGFVYLSILRCALLRGDLVLGVLAIFRDFRILGGNFFALSFSSLLAHEKDVQGTFPKGSGAQSGVFPKRLRKPLVWRTLWLPFLKKTDCVMTLCKREKIGKMKTHV